MGGWLAVSQLGKWAGGGAHPPLSTFWLHHSSPSEAQPRSPLPSPHSLPEPTGKAHTQPGVDMPRLDGAPGLLEERNMFNTVFSAL